MANFFHLKFAFAKSQPLPLLHIKQQKTKPGAKVRSHILLTKKKA